MSSFVEWLVRADVVAAGLLLLLVPLLLSALAARDTTVRLRMLTYWRAFAILPVSLFLVFQGQALGHVAALLGFFTIPVALWLGDVGYILPPTSLPRGGPLRRSYSSWRWLATVYCGAGLVLSTLDFLCMLGTGPAEYCEAQSATTAALAGYLQPEVGSLWILIPGYAAAGIYLAYAVLSVRLALRRVRRSSI